MPDAGQPTPPPYNDGDWTNPNIEAPEVAHPKFSQEDVEQSRQEQLDRIESDRAAREGRDPVFEKNRQILMEHLKAAKAEIQTDLAHEGERQHVRDTNPGMSAAELRERNALGDTGGWISGSMSTHPAGRAVREWDLGAAQHGRSDFQHELTALINKHSIDAMVGVPDFILAHYLHQAVKNLAGLQYSNRKWSER